MIINIVDNGSILKEKLQLITPNFVVLTGENGSGKTQLLQFIEASANGYEQKYNQEIMINPSKETKMLYPITDNLGKKLSNIIYLFPGLGNNNNFQQVENKSIEYIKQQWNALIPFIKASILIKGKKFNNEEEELRALNLAIKEFLESVTSNLLNGSQVNVPSITLRQLNELKDLSTKSNKSIDELTYIDFLIFYEIKTDIFSFTINLLFHQFHLKQKYYPDLTSNITPPWEVFNRISQNVKFKYKVEYNPPSQDEYPSIVNLIYDEKDTKDITFDTLSSGEKTIITLIFYLYHSLNNGQFPEVILFDEPDSHLHPSFKKLLISTITNLVEKENVKIIMTTHSPSTIAFSPEESVYRMDRSLGYPIKENKKNAIQDLSNGMISIAIEDGNLGIEYTLKSTEKNTILFTEGITDKIILQTAWQKLYSPIEMPFIIQECFCASFLANLFNNGNTKPDGIFVVNPDKKMIALFDFDRAGYNSWNSNKNFGEKMIETHPNKCLTVSNGRNAYKMLLPVPNIPAIQRQVIGEGKKTFKSESILTIEHLLFNVPRFEKKYFKKYAGAGGAQLFEFEGDKRKFSQNLQKLEKKDFNEFIPLFDKIKEISGIS
ncbi:ATP-binding protein [Chryseobacterium fistulae]|uniref:AAA+ ATPase domain-containing protein n=1 Tax=Chryseobacterium fistulae TaxID=2675058 RepID=A0A6N4XTE6_9FLAO|nr:ATP-binding protein [Chryseobacterium fistulae]CAA7389587.1 hypothetical protein CHRY9393_02172 [Chryseobacterium fistulae]